MISEVIIVMIREKFRLDSRLYTLTFTFMLFISDDDGKSDKGVTISLKGQMRYMEAWDSILFIATPV